MFVFTFQVGGEQVVGPGSPRSGDPLTAAAHVRDTSDAGRAPCRRRASDRPRPAAETGRAQREPGEHSECECADMCRIGAEWGGRKYNSQEIHSA